MAQYFTLNEMIYSDTAKKKGIDNTPSEEVKKHLNDLMAVLDKIRGALGKPITVSSGYRCPKLNAAVGGSATSGHLRGDAADLQVKGLTAKELGLFIQGYLQGANIAWDQLIVEKSGRTEWIHLGLKNQAGLQRKQLFSIIK